MTAKVYGLGKGAKFVTLLILRHLMCNIFAKKMQLLATFSGDGGKQRTITSRSGAIEGRGQAIGDCKKIALRQRMIALFVMHEARPEEKVRG